MKKQIIITLIFFSVISIILISNIYKQNNKKIEIKRYNSWFESYLNKEIYGTDIATIINKAVEENKKNNIQKDEKGLYIENNTNSIKIELNMITVKKTYQMETIYNKDISDFVKHFNIILFKCIDIQYHENTGKVSKIIFEQIDN